jgi:hypothetical protein
MKNQLLIASFALLLWGSCSTSRKEISIEKKMPTDSLSVFLGMPIAMNLHDEKLFVVDFYGEDGMLKVIDVRLDSSLFSIAKRGEGPNEYLSISNIDIFMESDQVMLALFDPSTKKYRQYSYEDLLANKSETLPFTNRAVKSDSFITEFFKIDSTYISTGVFDVVKFALYDDSLTFVKNACTYRPKPSPSIPDRIHAMANHGTSALSPDRKIIGNVVYIAGVINVFDVNKQAITPLWDYVIKEIDYSIEANNRIVNNQVYGYLSLSITDKYVFALYSGRNDNPNESTSYGNEIHLFDYQGNLLKKIDIQRDLLRICMDEKGKKMYAITHSPEPKILIYDMSL